MSSVEFYEKDGQGNEIYKISSYGNQYYATTSDVKKVFAKRAKLPYYAIRNADEFYPFFTDHEVFIIRSDGTQEYATKGDGVTQVHPKDREGKEFVLVDSGGNARYVKDAKGGEVYPRLANESNTCRHRTPMPRTIRVFSNILSTNTESPCIS